MGTIADCAKTEGEVKTAKFARENLISCAAGARRTPTEAATVGWARRRTATMSKLSMQASSFSRIRGTYVSRSHSNGPVTAHGEAASGPNHYVVLRNQASLHSPVETRLGVDPNLQEICQPLRHVYEIGIYSRTCQLCAVLLGSRHFGSVTKAIVDGA